MKRKIPDNIITSLFIRYDDLKLTRNQLIEIWMKDWDFTLESARVMLSRWEHALSPEAKERIISGASTYHQEWNLVRADYNRSPEKEYLSQGKRITHMAKSMNKTKSQHMKFLSKLWDQKSKPS